MKLNEQNKTGIELREERRELLDRMHLGLSPGERERLDVLDDLILQLPSNVSKENRDMLDAIRNTSEILQKRISEQLEYDSEYGITIGLIDSIKTLSVILRNRLDSPEKIESVMDALQDLKEDKYLKSIFELYDSFEKLKP